MVFHCLYKLAINKKPGKRKVIIFVKVFYVVFLLHCFRNFVHKTRAKVVNKEDVTAGEMTST